jgi:putative ABC transport system permease protein
VTPGYAEALGLRLHEGRFFNDRDVGAATQPMLVNREFVNQYLRRGSVVGRRFEGLFEEHAFVEIVGVVGNVLKDGLNARVQPEIYLLPGKRMSLDTEFAVVVRTSGDPVSLIPVLRAIVHDADRFAAVDELTTLEQRVSRSVSQPRFATLVLTAFAALALCLASVGMYGVLSYNVAQRRRELGVRAALGATRRDLLRLVLRDGLMLTLIGLALGIVSSAAVTRFMSNLLFGVKPLDGWVYGTAPLVLFAVAVAACALPARRAASADPVEALRAE